MTGATDGSMPVGSGRVFIQNSSNYRTSVLSNSDLFPATLFSETLLSAPLPTHAESMGLESVALWSPYSPRAGGPTPVLYIAMVT
jgi:hypothetical protein